LLALSTTAIVVIPSGFETDVKKKKQTRISVSVSNLKFVAASDVTRGINDVVASIAKDISTNVLKSAGYGSAQAEIAAEPVRPVYANLFNTTGSYGDFIILGILILILQQILLMGMSVSMSLERESKAVGHLFHSAGGSIPAVILGKSAFYFFLFAAHAFVFFTVYAWIYHIPVGGAVPAIIVFTCVHLISIIIWSMFVSSFFKTRLMAMCILLFTSYPLFLLSGFSWPLYCFPWYLQAVAFVLPSTPFFQVFPMITQMHAAWPDILPYLCHMVLLLSVGATALWVRLSIMKRK
jgi:ABC-2 type transport system permease protein